VIYGPADRRHRRDNYPGRGGAASLVGLRRRDDRVLYHSDEWSTPVSGGVAALWLGAQIVLARARGRRTVWWWVSASLADIVSTG
jgi:hypothetical protein